MATYFLSDLHVFSRRSLNGLYAEQLTAAASHARRIILGGDIFDFRWSTLSSFQATLDAAEAWLDELVGSRPECRFHYLLGNHDCHPDFVRRLDHFALRHGNFQWHEEYLRLEQDIFLHGDVLDGEATSHGLARRRARWEQERDLPGPVRNSLYDAAVMLRLHKVVTTVAHPRRRVARRLLAYLEHLGHGPETGLRRVFFGHTHAAMEQFRYADVSFHNGGAPIRGLQFRVVPVTPFVEQPVTALCLADR